MRMMLFFLLRRTATPTLSVLSSISGAFSEASLGVEVFSAWCKVGRRVCSEFRLGVGLSFLSIYIRHTHTHTHTHTHYKHTDTHTHTHKHTNTHTHTHMYTCMLNIHCLFRLGDKYVKYTNNIKYIKYLLFIQS